MRTLRKWVVKKIARNMPVIMNVTIKADSAVEIKGAEADGLFNNWDIKYLGGESHGEN